MTLMLDQKQIYRRRQQAAKTYDQAAIVQREIISRLIERLDYMLIKPETVLDVGAGTGYGTGLLQQLYPNAMVLSVDMSESLLQQQSSPYRVCADVQKLPLADHSQQLVVANLVLHWMSDTPAFLKELARVLHPKGVLLLTTMGLDTLKECRAAFAQMDNFPHVHDFFDMHDVGDSLLQQGFSDPVVDMQTITVNYKSVKQLFDDLKQLGATNAHNHRRRGLTGRKQWQKMLSAFAEMKNQTVIPVTYEIIFGHAWGVRIQQQNNNETSISLSSLKSLLGTGE